MMIEKLEFQIIQYLQVPRMQNEILFADIEKQ
jgi:hypothetical protein